MTIQRHEPLKVFSCTLLSELIFPAAVARSGRNRPMEQPSNEHPMGLVALAVAACRADLRVRLFTPSELERFTRACIGIRNFGTSRRYLLQ